MRRLVINLLGPVEIKLDGEPLHTDRHKAVGLLAFLATEDKNHSRDSLATLLWPDYPQQSAFSYLRRTLWELNQKLGNGWIEADREHVRLMRQPGLELDVEAFNRLKNQQIDLVTALSEAECLYRGDFLEGLVIADTAPFEEWQIQQAEAYRREYSNLLEQLAGVHEVYGAFEQALSYAQRWLSLDRINERACRAVMRQQAGMGNRSGVVHTYQSYAQTLQDELGVAPEKETQQLYQSILQGSYSTQINPDHDEKDAIREAGNLPTQATPFIGRDEEIKQVTQLALDPQVRLLTLTGPGGNGKTRLSIQVAEKIASSFPDGVWFIPLAAVQSAPAVVTAIAKCLNYSFYQGEVTAHNQLLDYLREKHLLLILDNFEHLLEGGRELVVDILGQTHEVKVLVTSRERLNLQPEQVFRLGGLRIPLAAEASLWERPEEQAQKYSALQLLAERARRVKPDFQISEKNLKSVIQICQLVDGSPLGIVLAAAWLEVLPEEEIVREIAHNLDFLESEAADTPTRQRSLRMVFDTSWRLLDSDEQQAFRRLCIFRGSFTRQAAQEVSGVSLRTLLSLANKSWLESNINGRYHLHEVMKQFGQERLKAGLGEWLETTDRHTEFYCTLMEVQAQALNTEDQVTALHTLAPELESNIPDVWEWLVSTGRSGDVIKRLLPGLFHYWLIRGVSRDYIPLLKQAQKAILPSPERSIILQQAILEIVSTTAELYLFVFDDHPKERLDKLWRMVDEMALKDELGEWYIVLIASYGNVMNFQEGSIRIEEALQKVSQAPDSWAAGNSYLIAGMFTNLNQADKCEEYLQKALAIFRKIGVVQEQGTTLSDLGRLEASRLNYKLAIDYTLEAQSLFQQVHDSIGLDYTWTNLAEYYIYLGEIQQAFHAFEELRHYNERTGNRRMQGTDLSWESLHIARYGELDRALELRRRSLEIAHEVGNQHDVAWATWELGDIYRLKGEVEQARKFYQQAQPEFERMQDLTGLGFYHRGLGDLAVLEGKLEEGRDQFRTALEFHEKEQRGNRVWGLSLTLARLGCVEVKLGELEESRENLIKSLNLAISWHNPDLKALPLVGIALWLAASGYNEQAIEVAACVASKPTSWNEVKEQAVQILQAVKSKLPEAEALRWEEEGEVLTIDEACQRYTLESFL